MSVLLSLCGCCSVDGEGETEMCAGSGGGARNGDVRLGLDCVVVDDGAGFCSTSIVVEG